VESVENQTQGSLSFHRPLEIRPTMPDSHIPTATTIPVPSFTKTKLMKGSRPLRGLPLRIIFRIILYWNRYLVSGSSLDWKMLDAGAFAKLGAVLRR
jgi:hypothetical protein